MKKVIELLEQAEGFALAGSRSTAVSCIEEALAELKAPSCRETPENDVLKIKNCIACKNYGNCPVDIDIINQELEPFPVVNRFGIHCHYYEKEFITPEQYEKRAREPWPDNGAVYFVERIYPRRAKR